MLDIDETKGLEHLSVTGNKCPRGEVYAHEEIRAPKRTVTATCMIEYDIQHGVALAAQLPAEGIKRLPVRTSSPCPREKIPALLKDIYKIKVTPPVKTGDVLIAGWQGGDINVIATRTVS